MNRTFKYAAGYLIGRTLYDAGITKPNPVPMQGNGFRVWWHNASAIQIYFAGLLVFALAMVFFVIGAFAFLVLLDQFGT